MALRRGEFFGDTRRSMRTAHLVLTDTRYTHARVEWHAHEHAYFTFLLQGQLVEINRSGRFHYGPGDLLFHHWQDAHANERPTESGRGFHVEVAPAWFGHHALRSDQIEGAQALASPLVRMRFYRLHRELAQVDPLAELCVESLLLEVFGDLMRISHREDRHPAWTSRIRDMLHELTPDSLDLRTMAEAAGVHPVHLCRAFPRHFGLSFGDYARLARTERACRLMLGSNQSLAHIAHTCGFSDQSHMVRAFRRILGVTPSAQRAAFGRTG